MPVNSGTDLFLYQNVVPTFKKEISIKTNSGIEKLGFPSEIIYVGYFPRNVGIGKTSLFQSLYISFRCAKRNTFCETIPCQELKGGYNIVSKLTPTRFEFEIVNKSNVVFPPGLLGWSPPNEKRRKIAPPACFF